MTVTSKFNRLEREAPDPIVQTMTLYANDPSPNKVDVSIGVYKSEKGGSYLFPCVAEAKKVLAANDPGHNYTNMQGIPEFISGARKVAFGEEYAAEGKLASLQTISGTGALHMGFVFLREAGYTNFYLGVPSWSNYIGMIEFIGSKVTTFTHYNEKTKKIEFDAVVSALESAPANSVFLFQTCCHNPTGADYSQEQWKKIGQLLKQRDLIAVLDTAYQGFSSGDKDKDAWAIRHFYELGLEFVVCQSFSKNLGLYGERVGCVHAVVQDKEYVPNAQSTLVANFRSECSFAPAYGARLASIIFQSPELKQVWDNDVAEITERLKTIRKKVLDILTELKTPGKWDHVVEQEGLFWYSGLTPVQNDRLISEHNVYSTSIGRVNIAGLNNNNVEYFCKAIDEVVRNA
ncbi:aspartate aminotransferase/Glutamic oxaloacetic transaminase AAT2/GOT1 [Scheffersomyces xylosifermentans]|uniref:aspartate aminotransferase/Glutamic oxaloacetic transaminase AAT2/GOT1 n=1 Tax=Scheffersomyces xylosifermentans TaxID=1304137 RepID=UPI00315CA00D